jgi:hypothetical protein
MMEPLNGRSEKARLRANQAALARLEEIAAAAKYY